MLYIFDMGGVVAGNVSSLPAMADRLGLSQTEFLACCGIPEGTPAESVFTLGLLADVQAGRIDSAGFWRAFRGQASRLLSGDPRLSALEEATVRENLWESCFHPELLAGTVAVIEALKVRGHRVVCGTNTLDAHFAVHERRGDYGVFAKVYSSHHLGVIKPDPEFWTKILAAEGRRPGEAVFIDDHPANVAAATALGLEAHRFTSSTELETQLRSAF